MAKKSILITMLLVYIISSLFIFVPGAYAQYYQIQPGDSLWRISRMFDTTVNALKAENNQQTDLIYAYDTLKIPEPPVTTMSQTNASQTNLSQNDMRLLAHIIHAEARGESYLGKVAVGAVVLNRVASSDFPNTVSAVIYQSGQYSPVTDGSINLAPDAESIRAANDAASGWDPTGGALFFYNPSKVRAGNYVWSRPVITTIGNHTFAR